MHERIVLIVESDISDFALRLQEAIEQTGLNSLIFRDPHAANGLTLLKRFKYSAAAINVQYKALAAQLAIPVLLYGGSETPAHPALIVAKLMQLLA
jgi:hypothetical protein